MHNNRNIVNCIKRNILNVSRHFGLQTASMVMRIFPAAYRGRMNFLAIRITCLKADVGLPTMLIVNIENFRLSPYFLPAKCSRWEQDTVQQNN